MMITKKKSSEKEEKPTDNLMMKDVCKIREIFERKSLAYTKKKK